MSSSNITATQLILLTDSKPYRILTVLTLDLPLNDLQKPISKSSKFQAKDLAKWYLVCGFVCLLLGQIFDLAKYVDWFRYCVCLFVCLFVYRFSPTCFTDLTPNYHHICLYVQGRNHALLVKIGSRSRSRLHEM